MSIKVAAYTLITGASKGIGMALANECASRGRNLVLIALPGEGLTELAGKIRKQFNVDVIVLETDLATENAGNFVFEWCMNEGIEIDFLINNAGFGTLGTLDKSDLSVHRSMMRLHMDTPYVLIRKFLPELARHPNAYILNVASQAAFFPIPHKATYGATKVFLLHLSCALQWELKESNIKVSALSPSGVMTTPEVRARITSAGFWSKMAALEPEDVARLSIDGTMRGKRHIVPGFVNKITHFLSRVFPMWLSMSMAAKRFSREPEPLKPEKQKV
ncbi:MAG TPA: SDR family NAD(P)-dependent oxidoreductase [Bacteroidetes bacterium]|nr:SDR family NAD(P)-dependent oxidoreductase [Bacteroidota bacterium]